MSNDDFEIIKLNYVEDDNSAIKLKVNTFLEGTFFNIFITVVTLWAQFGDDVRIIVVNKEADETFSIMTIIVFLIFCLEVGMASYATENYINGFYYWLDIVSTASLLLDIGWISDVIFQTGGGGGGGESAASIAKAARASRIGTRAARVIRIIRLIRLIRIIKLYKQAEKAEEEAAQKRAEEKEKKRDSNYQEGEEGIHRDSSENEFGQRKSAQGIDGDDLDISKTMNQAKVVDGKVIGKDVNIEDMMKESNVGKKLGAKTNKIVVILILSIMMTIPLFGGDTYIQEDDEYQGALKGLAMHMASIQYNVGTGVSTLAPIISAAWIRVIEKYGDERIPMVWMRLLLDNNDLLSDIKPMYGNANKVAYQRTLEMTTVSMEYTPENLTNIKYTLIAYWDARPDAILGGVLGLLRTIFVCIILAGASMQMNADAEDLVITPIETMISKVKRISKNPLEAAQIEEQDALAWEELAQKDKKIINLVKEKSKFETAMLESIIVKIGALLALGFGEAGAEIIAANMAKSGGVDPMLDGNKMFAVFGFCDIRSFADITEILQIDVMMFVNEIADIVHNIVDDYSGAPNKNIGDAFLLIWKIPGEEIRTDNDDQLIMKGGPKTQAIADMATFSFLKIVASINKSKKLAKYRDHEGLNKRMPNFRVRMGFGLHIGWGIEGAVGSKFKIDASYLSPNVNMAARLEAATRQFGVTLLISGGVYRFASDAFKKVQRHIDRVTVKGSIQPIDFHTIDTDHESLGLDSKEKENMTGIEKRKMNVRRKLERDQRKERIFSQKLTTSKLLEVDTDYLEMRKPFKQAFYVRWENAQQLYLEGQWEMAKPILEETLNMIPGRVDGPSATLQGVISDNNGRAPETWKGYRPLTEK